MEVKNSNIKFLQVEVVAQAVAEVNHIITITFMFV